PRGLATWQAAIIYLERLQHSANISRERMDEIVLSHVADPGAMRTDNFSHFFATRQRAQLDRIEYATGKLINRATTLLKAQERDEFTELTEEIEEEMPAS
ncbi:MAG TPA: hypothetical protein VKB35_03240, partial [Ktedonobacteraceae bacterium]|nr:hypothetical protein [Ktedonobacteraceae bacterium]